MITNQIARMIAHYVLVMNIGDDEVIDQDAAVEAMEMLASDLAALDKEFLRELIESFAVIASEYKGASGDLVRNIPEHLGLEDELVDDDAVIATGPATANDSHDQER